MTWLEMTRQRLMEAQRELEAAEQGLLAGTEVARDRYAKAVHEAELAEQQVSRASREQRQQSVTA
jgi:hypothetical protein